MNKRIKIKIWAFLLIAGTAFSAAAQDPSFAQLQKRVDDFSLTLAKSLPLNSALGLNWSDAYIGKVFPSVPPHFGIGGSFGITTMDLPVMKDLAETLGYSVPFDIGRMILPAYAAEARVGGIFLPFDVGFKFGYLPPVGVWGADLDMNYLNVGGDLRYALIDGKEHKLLPNLSVGVGINYLKGGISGKAGSNQRINFGDDDYIELASPEVGLQWESTTLDFKVQVSKSLLIITPYLGLGGSYAWSKAGYSVDSAVSAFINGGAVHDLGPDDLAAINDYLRSLGLEEIDGDRTGISSIIENKAFSFRAFGGLSLNLALIRLDLTGLYSFRDGNYGASLGFRFQL